MVATELSVHIGYYDMIERVASLAVRYIAKFCFIDLNENGVLTRRIITLDPDFGPLPTLLQAPHPDVGEGVAAVLRGGTALVYGPSWFDALKLSDRALVPFSSEQLQAIVIVPLTYDNRPLGTLTLGAAEDVGTVDIDLVGDFARLASMAIANARLRDETDVATVAAEATRVRLSYVSRASSIFARSFDRAAVMQRFVTTTTVDFAATALALIATPDTPTEEYHAGHVVTDELRQLSGDVVLDGRSRLADGDRSLAAPLLTGGGASGALTFRRSPEQPPFGIDDLTLAEDLAARTALYIEASRAYEHQRRVADTLQQAFRPRDLPNIPGLTISAAYRPSTVDMDVGGDWYDVVVMDDRRVAFAIGDVMGHGLEAAAVMAEIRSGLRAHLYAQSDPGRCLGYVDTLLTNAKERDMFATGAVAFYDRYLKQLTLASAGHPLPYVRRTDGTVEALGRSTTLLGLDMGARSESVHQLGAGDIVVFFTDGVVEDRALSFESGIASLETALLKSHEPGTIIEDLLAISLASTDDRTLLAFQIA